MVTLTEHQTFDLTEARKALPKELTRTRLLALLHVERFPPGGASGALIQATEWLAANRYITYGPFPYNHGSGSGSHSYRIEEKGRAILALLHAPYLLKGPVLGTHKLSAQAERAMCFGVLRSIEGTLRINPGGVPFFFPASADEKINSVLGVADARFVVGKKGALHPFTVVGVYEDGQRFAEACEAASAQAAEDAIALEHPTVTIAGVIAGRHDMAG